MAVVNSLLIQYYTNQIVFNGTQYVLASTPPTWANQSLALVASSLLPNSTALQAITSNVVTISPSAKFYLNGGSVSGYSGIYTSTATYTPNSGTGNYEIDWTRVAVSVPGGVFSGAAIPGLGSSSSASSQPGLSFSQLVQLGQILSLNADQVFLIRNLLVPYQPQIGMAAQAVSEEVLGLTAGSVGQYAIKNSGSFTQMKFLGEGISKGAKGVNIINTIIDPSLPWQVKLVFGSLDVVLLGIDVTIEGLSEGTATLPLAVANFGLLVLLSYAQELVKENIALRQTQ